MSRRNTCSFSMLYLWIILTFGVLFYSCTGTAYFRLTGNSISGPLMTSNYMTQLPAGNFSHSLVTSLNKIINVLQWNQVTVLSDPLHCEEVWVLNLGRRLNSLHCFDDIDNDIEMKQLLQQLHTQFFPKLHFLLLSNYSTALQVLEMVEQTDRVSKRSTDFRHFSLWLVGCFEPCDPSTINLPNIEQMENVALVYLHTNDKTVFNQLLPVSKGRIFSTWRNTEEIKVEDDVFPNRRYGLNNRTLIVSLQVDEPYVIKTKKGFEGHYIDMLNSIASTMNFSYETVHSEDVEWGKLVDGKWDGLIGQLERRVVDLVVTTLSIHEDREKVMDFLYPPIRIKVDDVMYRLHSEDTENWKIYLKPFKHLVLVVLLVSLVTFALVAGMVFLYEGHVYGNPIKLGWRYQLQTLTDALFYMIGILLNRGEQSNPRRQSTRLFLFTWGVFSVIIAACYCANLVASVSVKKPNLPFTSLGELVRQKEYKFGFYSGSIREHIFKLSRTGDMKLAWEVLQEIYKSDPEVLSNNFSVHITKVKSEKYALILPRDTIQRLRSDDCSIRYVGQDIIWHQNGIGVPTNYPLRRELEHTLSHIVDSGLPDIWWRRWGATREDHCDPDDTVKPLTLSDTVSAFYLLCGGLGVSCVALAIEIIKYRQQVERNDM